MRRVNLFGCIGNMREKLPLFFSISGKFGIIDRLVAVRKFTINGRTGRKD